MKNKKKLLAILSLFVIAILSGYGAYSFFTAYQVKILKAEGGIALELSGDAGISSMSQKGFVIKKEKTGWYQKGANAEINAEIKNGYAFDGWYEGKNLISRNIETNINIDRYKKLNAQTTTIPYSISYDLQGGTVSGNPESYHIESESFTLKNPTKIGYTFTGWTGSNGEELQTSVSIIKGSMGNKTYMAHWRKNILTINYYGNNATFGTFKGEEIAKPNGKVFIEKMDRGATAIYGLVNYDNVNSLYLERTGYTRTGNWVNGSFSLNQNLENLTSNQIATEFGKNLDLGDQTIDVYAEWKANTYSINYNPNQGIGTMAGSSHTYDVFKPLNQNNFSFYGNTFIGWNTSAYGTGKQLYKDKEAVINMMTGNDSTLPLYAQWAPGDASVIIKYNNGTPDYTSTIHDYCSSVHLDVPVRQGYTFSGWSVLSGNAFFGDRTTLDPSYRNGLGGVTAYNNMENGAVTINRTTASDDNPTSSDYELVITSNGNASPGYGGFFLARNAEPYKTYICSFIAKVPKGISLDWAHNEIGEGHSERWLTPKYGTGKWETYAYEIKSGNTPAYNRSFGHVYMDVIEQGVTFPISIKLAHYQISEKGKGQEQLIYGIGNSVISANWKPNTYNVAYDANNGTDERITNTHTYDTSEVIQVNSFSRTGHQFKEWNTKPDGSGISYQNGQQIKNLTSVNGGTVILYAQWNEEVNNIIGKISESYINEYNDTVEKDLANKLDAPEEEKEPIEPAEQTDQKNEKEEMVIP